jgi:hypothetical protein
VEGVEKHLRNDIDVVVLLNMLEMENISSVHIYVEHRVDEAVIVDQPLFLPPPSPHPDGPNDDVNVGDGEAGINVGDGDGRNNAKGNVGDEDDISVEGRSKVVRKKKKKKEGRGLLQLKMMGIVERRVLLPLKNEVLGLVLRLARLLEWFTGEVVGQIKVVLKVTVEV